jgi:polyisoprenoid-binding protein YceI
LNFKTKEMKKFALISSSLAIIAAVVAFKPATTVTPDNPSSTNAPAAAKWSIDKAHSNVKFTITHMVVSDVDGSFKNFDGSLEHNKPDFSDAVVNFTVDVASIDTDNENRDNHLKSDDFFSAAKYPQMKFTSTSFKPLGGNKFEVNGNLTIKDVTKPVKFDVTYGGTSVNGGKSKAGFKAKTTINRFDYNLKWDRATEAGGLVVSKEVDITINAQLNKE